MRVSGRNMLNVSLYRKLAKTPTHITLILLIASCTGNQQSELHKVASLNPIPRVVPINCQGGYSVNPLTGDSIQPIINSMGDTVKTGVPVPAKGRVIDPGSVSKPKVIPAGRPEVLPIHQNVHKIPEFLTVIPVDSGTLTTITPGEDNVPLPVSVPAKEKVIPCMQPKPVKAYPPLIKDNARSNIKFLDLNQGMNSSVIFSILEDSRGNLWFGSGRRGVSMYNGETFTHFTKNEGLTSNQVRSILEDSHGNIWIAAMEGVCKYNGETFMHLTENEGLIQNTIWSMLIDSKGNLWIGTLGGVSKYDGQSFTNFTRKEGICDDWVWSIQEDRRGNLWFGTRDGVCRYDGKSFVHFTEKDGLCDNWVNSILEDRYGNLWFGTEGGLSRFDGKSFTNFTIKEGLSDNVVRSILEDSQGNLWFGTNGGVNLYNGETFRHFTLTEGLSDNTILAILEDSHGNLWFGTESGGVSIYYGESFSHLALKEDLSNIHVRSILEDIYGNLWFGTWKKGVYMYNGETLTHFTEKEGLNQNTVFSILEDSRDNLWFGSGIGGVSKYDGKTFTYFTKEEGLSDDYIWSILEDSHGNLWFGTDKGGVSMYDGQSFTHFSEKEGLSQNTVFTIMEDRQGNIWFGGSPAGVSKYDGKTFIHYTGKEGLFNQNVRSILEDSRGHIWFGSYAGGLSMFNGEIFTLYTQKDGLSDNWVESIEEDGNNNIWVSTRNGLTRLAFSTENDSVPEIQTYDLQDGLKGIEFNQNSVLLDSKNRIWWGSVKGISMLDISHLEAPTGIPIMQLNRIDINGEFTDFRHLDEADRTKMKFNGVAKFHNYPLNLELPHNRNHLTFYFAATDWSAPHKIRYSYKMEGLDDKWSIPSAEANAEYRNMPYGRYTFQVRVVGASQQWSVPVEYPFKILPPIWFKWWAYVIYALILLLLVRRYRGFLIKREKINADLRIKEMEVNKMQELDHMKSRFFANISHEFRTPLTLIQGPIEELRKKTKGEVDGSKHLFKAIKRNTLRLQELINQLLDISKLETGKINLRVSEGNLIDHVKAIVLSFLSLADYKKIKYEYNLPKNGRMVYFDADKVEKIITNLISNAFKFTYEWGMITVSVQFLNLKSNGVPDTVEIKVSDTGKGIPSEKLDKIFDRFYRISDPDTGEHEGTGLGLSLTKELVDLYRGSITVESKVGKGSIFTVNLPVAAAHFREEEIVSPSSDEEIRMKPDVVVHEQEEFGTNDMADVPTPGSSTDIPEILIVEDNDELRKYISRTLEKNYRRIFAENGKTGLTKAYDIIPDLVISDVMMPEMNGMEMCKRLKSDERTNHIPVIMLTARADRYSKLEGLETGADDYLVKPFDTLELKIRVKNLLEQRRKLRDKFRLEFLSDNTDLGLPPKDQFIKRLTQIFDRHISDPEFKINQLSRGLNLSQSQVRRKVMAITGYSPNELFRNHRLKKAAGLFRSGHTHIAQVMNQVGFNNQSYFTKCFRELYEMTPSQFITFQKSKQFPTDA